MIYFDHAATSYPKSTAVYRAADQALRCYAANPGRSGYAMSLATSEAVYNCRERAATLFGVHDPRRVILMSGCTQALNTAIKSVLKNGGRAVVSDLEHNAVMRPLYALSPYQPIYDVAHVTVGDDDQTVAAFAQAIGPKTKAVVCTHASNVIGYALPIARIAAVAHERGIPIIVDAAQSAGHLPINLEDDALDCVCAAGHKGLGGPMGTGLLMCREDFEIEPLVEGGTGSDSLSYAQPLQLPDRLESGTPNVPGICALRAGIDRVLRIGVERLSRHEIALGQYVHDGLQTIQGIATVSPRPQFGHSTAVVSFCPMQKSVEDVCQALSHYGVAVRGGLHCAPLAHETIGSLPQGTVRLSFGASNTWKEAEMFLQILKKIL